MINLKLTSRGVPMKIGKTRMRTLLYGLTGVGTLVLALPVHAQEMGEGDPEKVGIFFLAMIVLAVPMVLGLAGFAMLLRGLFPKKVDWTGEIMGRIPWGSFWLGLGGTIVVVLVAAAIGGAGEAGGVLAAFIIAAYLIMFVVFGKIALIFWAGEIVDPASSGIRKVILGSSALYAIIFIPVVGWIFAMGLSFMGVGAAIMSWFPSRAPEKPAVAPEIYKSESTPSESESE